MSSTGLPARIAYALLATPLSAIGGFYLGVLLFTRMLPHAHGSGTAELDWTGFALSVILGLAVGFPVLCWSLTLPRLRLRRRNGRGWRIAVSSAVIFAVSMFVHAEGLPIRYTVVLMIWMAVILLFTFIRYGLLGGERRARSTPTA